MPSVEQALPNTSPDAVADGSVVATSANATATTAPKRRALKGVIPLAFIVVVLSCRGFIGLTYHSVRGIPNFCAIERIPGRTSIHEMTKWCGYPPVTIPFTKAAASG
ncbi:unannotated protein [freshwater metagenome]|uniref:Unannotated protein n=1 Tax=freshwater metagenome TaxID=449393 RepID=A0A6J7PQ71_9ZZZZ